MGDILESVNGVVLLGDVRGKVADGHWLKLDLAFAKTFIERKETNIYLGNSKPFEGKSKFVVVLEPLPLPPFVEDWEAFTRAATTIQASCPLTPLCADCPYPLVRGSDTPSIVLKAPVSVPSSIPCTNHPADPEGYWKDILRQPIPGRKRSIVSETRSQARTLPPHWGKSITHTLALETIRLLEPAGTIHIPVSTVSKESDWLLNL
ncbi:hypothetical protein DFS34DRAFT_651922 [Phlyctochytrium arcticum]|nr:hypothetical protein DFS34DRAFT_651922 [Phlyctochytrium arcticum]